MRKMSDAGLAAAILVWIYSPQSAPWMPATLSRLMTDQRDLAEALHTIETDEKVYGPDHPRIAEDANHIGTILPATCA
jgi:hypothetical protein